MCGGLCDAVLGRKDSASHLESLERANRFLVPLDHTRTWYRYHHLFRDLLRSELEHREPELAPELRRQAMAWCEANGAARVGAALCARGRRHLRRHAALRAADPADLLRRWRRHDAVAGSTGTTRTACASGTRRSLSSARGSASSPDARRRVTLGPRGAEQHRVARAARRQRDDRAMDRGPSGLHVPGRGRADALGRGARAGELGPEGWWRPSAQLAAGVAHALLGDAERARPALVLGRELAAAAGGTDEESCAVAELALLAIDAGAKEQAAAHAGERSRSPKRQSWTGTWLRAGYATAARVALHRGELTKAREYIAIVHRIRPLFNTGFPWLSVQTGLELTRIHLALGEARVAGTVLSEADAILRARPGLGTLSQLADELRQRIAMASTSERRVGTQPHGGRAARPATADHASRVPTDRRAAVPLAHDGQDPRRFDLSQVRRLIARRGDRTRR